MVTNDCNKLYDEGGYWRIKIWFKNPIIKQLLSKDTSWFFQNMDSECSKEEYSISHTGMLFDSEHQVVNAAMSRYLSNKPSILKMTEYEIW